MSASLDEANYNYSLDAPASTSTNFYLLIGDNAYGATGFSGDIDAYALHVDPGSRYTIIATDNSNGFETDLGVYDRNGGALYTSTDYGTYTGVSFTASDSLYYVAAQSSGVGVYGLRVGNNTITESNGISENIYSGQTYHAALDYTSDSDHFLFTALAGHTYRIDISTAIPDLFLKVSTIGSTSDVPLTLVASAGGYVFTPSASGAYDLSISANSFTSTGSYSFTTSEVSGGGGMTGTDGPDNIVGSASTDNIVSGGGNDTVLAGDGNDTISDSAGNNYLRGGSGDDQIFGGSGYDDVNGNQGQDTIDGGAGGNDWLLGGQGNDQITAHAGDVIINGNLGDDTVTGGAGADFVRGGQGSDLLTGGAGNDHLLGDRGNDTLTGGLGADTFHFAPGGGHDLITDFDGAAGDRIHIDAGVATYQLTQVNSEVQIDFGNGDVLILQNQSTAFDGMWLLG